MNAGSTLFVNSQVRNDRDKIAKLHHVVRLFTGDEKQLLMMTNGKNIPLRADIVSRAAPAQRPQWTTYGLVAPRVVTVPVSPHDQLAVEGADMTAIFSQILTGHIPITGIRTALEDLDRRYNAALQQAYQRNIIRRDDYVDPTLEARYRAR